MRAGRPRSQGKPTFLAYLEIEMKNSMQYRIQTGAASLAVLLLVCTLTAIVFASRQQQPAQQPRPAITQVSPEEAAREINNPRSKWFREAKFGLFIHWGLYAIPAGTWKGQQIPGIGEWMIIALRFR